MGDGNPNGPRDADEAAFFSWLHGVPLVPFEEAMRDLVGVPFVTRGFIAAPSTAWTRAEVDDLVVACVAYDKDNLANRKGALARDEGLAVAAFDIKRPWRFPLCVALSAAFDGCEGNNVRTSRLRPWRKYAALLFSGLNKLEARPCGKARRDIAVSEEYARKVLPHKFAPGIEATLWNPSSVTFLEYAQRPTYPGFAWWQEVAELKPVLVRFYFYDVPVVCSTHLYWGRAYHDENILIPPVRLRVLRVERRELTKQQF